MLQCGFVRSNLAFAIVVILHASRPLARHSNSPSSVGPSLSALDFDDSAAPEVWSG